MKEFKPKEMIVKSTGLSEINKKLMKIESEVTIDELLHLKCVKCKIDQTVLIGGLCFDCSFQKTNKMKTLQQKLDQANLIIKEFEGLINLENKYWNSKGINNDYTLIDKIRLQRNKVDVMIKDYNDLR